MKQAIIFNIENPPEEVRQKRDRKIDNLTLEARIDRRISTALFS